MPNARLAKNFDLIGLLELFRLSEVSPTAEPIERAEQIWLETLSHENVAVFVSVEERKIVATCMLFTAPNLLRAGQRHGFLENVVTHPNSGGKATGEPLFELHLKQLGLRTVIMSSFRAVARTRGCIAFTSAVASSRVFVQPMLRVAPLTADFHNWFGAAAGTNSRNSGGWSYPSEMAEVFFALCLIRGRGNETRSP